MPFPSFLRTKKDFAKDEASFWLKFTCAELHHAMMQQVMFSQKEILEEKDIWERLVRAGASVNDLFDPSSRSIKKNETHHMARVAFCYEPLLDVFHQAGGELSWPDKWDKDRESLPLIIIQYWSMMRVSKRKYMFMDDHGVSCLHPDDWALSKLLWLRDEKKINQVENYDLEGPGPSFLSVVFDRECIYPTSRNLINMMIAHGFWFQNEKEYQEALLGSTPDLLNIIQAASSKKELTSALDIQMQDHPKKPSKIM